MTSTTARVFAHDHALLDLGGARSLADALARWVLALGVVAADERDPGAARALSAVTVDVEHLLDRFGPASVQHRSHLAARLAGASEVGR